MITHSFDNKTEAIIKPPVMENPPVFEACILTFSYIIEEYVLNNFKCRETSILDTAGGKIPVYLFEHNGKTFAFSKTGIGAPLSVGIVEEALVGMNCKKLIVFGGAGCLDKEIAHGKVMVPTEAYRDEGTSYHYKEASDYITIKNSPVVAEFMKKARIPYVLGKTWTTDAFYRETQGNFQKRKDDGCISVEMESSALQAVCDFRGIEFYTFFTSGDLLDAPEWDTRTVPGEYKGTQHDTRHFHIALELADYICDLK